jgi:hypothetical protein
VHTQEDEGRHVGDKQGLEDSERTVQPRREAVTAAVPDPDGTQLDPGPPQHTPETRNQRERTPENWIRSSLCTEWVLCGCTLTASVCARAAVTVLRVENEEQAAELQGLRQQNQRQVPRTHTHNVGTGCDYSYVPVSLVDVHSWVTVESRQRLLVINRTYCVESISAVPYCPVLVCDVPGVVAMLTFVVACAATTAGLRDPGLDQRSAGDGAGEGTRTGSRFV